MHPCRCHWPWNIWTLLSLSRRPSHNLLKVLPVPVKVTDGISVSRGSAGWPLSPNLIPSLRNTKTPQKDILETPQIPFAQMIEKSQQDENFRGSRDEKLTCLTAASSVSIKIYSDRKFHGWLELKILKKVRTPRKNGEKGHVTLFHGLVAFLLSSFFCDSISFVFPIGVLAVSHGQAL